MYFKIFFATSISLGLMLGIQTGLTKGLVSGIKTGATLGLFFGFFMSMILGTLQKFKIKKISNSSNISPTQSITIELESSLEVAFNRCIQALTLLGAIIQSKAHSPDKTKSEISALSGMTWKNSGEIITIRMMSTGNRKVKIKITSSPKSKITIVDFGKGRKNIEKIAKNILTPIPKS